jgi:ketosteroid isomerase-like protein
MNEPRPSFEADTETLRTVYAALNRNDIPALAGAFAPEIVWVDPGESPEENTYRGHVAVIDLFARARATWAEGSCEPERFIPAGDKIVVFNSVRVRLKDSPHWLEGLTADVHTFRNGKVVHARVFVDRQEALKWAGADDPVSAT